MNPDTQEDEGSETYSAVTRFEATNADMEEILLGRHEDSREMAVPEVHDGNPVRARRRYEPVDVVSLPGNLSREDAIEWVENHRYKFEDYDWEEADRRELLDVIVSNRNSFRSTLGYFERQLAEVHAVGMETKEQLNELREEMADAMTSGPAVEVNCVESEVPADD